MLSAVSLRTEYLKNPIAIDFRVPRFYWKLEGDGKYQTAYQILALDEHQLIVWNSKKVLSDTYTGIRYQGRELHSRERIYWKVKLWDDHQEEGDWSELAFFEMGLLKESDWSAEWVMGDYSTNKKDRYPADYFRKTFRIDGEVERARLYATACGIYETSINGIRVGDQYFTPGYTNYKKRIQYQTYDVVELLENGENRLDFILGDGWYRGKVGALGHICVYGKETKLLAQLEIFLKDGREIWICSDDSFLWCNDGKIRNNDLMDGEYIESSYEASYCKHAKITSYRVVPVCSNNVPVREMERLTPEIIRSSKGDMILDFKQNISGILEIKVKGMKGSKVKFRMGETLDQHGEFTQKNFQYDVKNPVLQQMIYVCSGGEDYYKQKFSFAGFRYVLVVNPNELEYVDVTAIAVYSDMEVTGYYECSNSYINQLYRNSLWSMKGNCLDIMTDCPTRERAGWVGDAQIHFNAGSYLMDTAAFYRKWMADITDTQEKSGRTSCIAPTVGCGAYVNYMDRCWGWSDAAILIPYYYYKIYGDYEFLKHEYQYMKAYAEFLIRRISKNFIKDLFNEASSYDCEEKTNHSELGNLCGESIRGVCLPAPRESIAYFTYTIGCLSEVAKTIGEHEDAERYLLYVEGASQAYRHLFVEDTLHVHQADLVRPLAYGILKKGVDKRVYQNFIRLIREYNHTIRTGFLSTPLVLSILSNYGDSEDAYKMLEQEEAPGWLYQIKQGATTTWETWTGIDDTGDVSSSYNHYAFGAVCEWLFAYSAGIQIAGERSFVIHPIPGGTLSYVKCAYDSIYGRVVSDWKKIGEGVKYHIEIPAGTSAALFLEGKEKMELQCGIYDFIC